MIQTQQNVDRKHTTGTHTQHSSAHTTHTQHFFALFFTVALFVAAGFFTSVFFAAGFFASGPHFPTSLSINNLVDHNRWISRKAFAVLPTVAWAPYDK